MNYIRTHWRGEQPLVWSLWVNLVLVRILILHTEQYTLPPYIGERPDAIVATLIFGVICHGLVYLWQVVGLVRACERRSGGINSDIWVWTSYMAIIVSLVFTLLGIFGAYQSLSAERFHADDRLSLEQARATQYELGLDATGMLIHIKGIMALGMTAKLRSLLDQNPAVSGIVLESDGGQVYEGRGIAQLIKRRDLNTFVYGICKSACATAFIGGTRRSIGNDAKLGFHKYSLELWYPIPLFDLKEEQEKDVSFYRQQSISENFLTKIFTSEHEDIWFPDHKELLEAGVVHNIVDE